MRGPAQSSTVRPRTLSALGVMYLLLAAGASPPSTAAEPTGDVSAITLVEQRSIDIGDGRLIALSPDGEAIAVSRPAGPEASEVCIHDVATLEQRLCADVRNLSAGLWVDSVVWSPDSQWLAFAELWPMYLVDGDLWLMDASTGGLTNLLDDGYDGVLDLTPAEDSEREGVITLPMYPTFTPDSAGVTFSRTAVQAGEIRGADIATVPITGGDPVTLGGTEREDLEGEYRSKDWTADGSALFASLVEYSESGLGPDSGIWVFGAGGEEARQVAGLTDPDDWPPRLIRVSPRGEHLLVVDPTSVGRFSASYALVDGTSGGVEPIETLGAKASRSMPFSGVRLSPDGLLLLTLSSGHGKQVAVRDLSGSNEKVLLTEPTGASPSDLAGAVLTWADNDVVLVGGYTGGRGTLLFLDREGHDGGAGK